MDKYCEDCYRHFPTPYAKTVHRCEGRHPESDSKILAFLARAKEEKELFEPQDRI